MGDVIKKGARYIYRDTKRRLPKLRKGLIGPLKPAERREKAYRVRADTAKYWRQRRLAPHPSNGDESRYRNKIGSYSKGLPHNELGEVHSSAYRKLIEALKTGEPKLFESLTLGGATKLVDPQAAYAYELAGPDSHQMTMPAPPAFSSAQMAAEMVELYWFALTRDVPFAEYESSPLIAAAAAELSSLAEFPGPLDNGRVTRNTLFRDEIKGDLEGPRISQFLWLDIPFVTTRITQRYITAAAGDDHLTSYPDWLAVQNGAPPQSRTDYDPVPRYIRNSRDLAHWVHNDRTIDAGEIACRILLSYGEQAMDPANPYSSSSTQTGFPTFGPPHILDFVVRSARPALEAAWFQKWLVHRRIRPEMYGGRVHNQLTGAAEYPLHPQLLHSEAVARTFQRYGTYLLPQAYPEGCPTHPSYPSGHSTYIGAMVTMLKVFFDESFVLPDPVVASHDGLQLLPYEGPPLTVGAELNKLASNIGNARIAAGVHFRSSNFSALQLGEAIAIGIMRDYRATYNEAFKGFTLTKFDGTVITI